MPDKVRIALDAMGGDHGAAVLLPGADVSLTRHPDIEYVLFGNKAVVEPVLNGLPRLKAKSKLVHTEISIRMDDKPSQALRYGRWKSSMWLAIDAVKKGEADVVVSAGNTGALMAMARFNLKMIEGIERPAIAAEPPMLAAPEPAVRPTEPETVDTPWAETVCGAGHAPEAIPDVASEQVKVTVAVELFQPAVLGAGETDAVITGAVWSTLMPLTVAEVELSAMSLAVPLVDWFAPSTANVCGTGHDATPESVSPHDHVKVTGALYQPLTFGAGT